MKIVADGFYNIIGGLEKVRGYEELLGQAWGHKLEDLKTIIEEENQEIYQSKLRVWELANQQLIDGLQAKIKSNKSTRIVIGILFSFFLLGMPAVYALIVFLLDVVSNSASQLSVGLAETAIRMLVISAPAIIGFFLISPIVIMGMWIQARNMDTKGRKGVPKPAIDRINFSVPKNLDLESTWWERLARTPRPIQFNHGYRGEQLLLKYLDENIISDHICIINLMVGNKLDADLVLIGPNGVWILESKYISGVIHLNSGVWSREKSFYAPGGYLRSKKDYLGDIEGQWIREKKAVDITINRSFPSITKAHPSLVKGGLVFSHNRSRVIVDSDSNVPWGNFKMWASVINKHQDNGGHPQESTISKTQVFDIVEVLLERSRKISPSQVRSSINIASEVYNDRKRGIVLLSEQHCRKLEPQEPINMAVTKDNEIEQDIYQCN